MPMTFGHVPPDYTPSKQDREIERRWSIIDKDTDRILSECRSCLMIADRSNAWRDERDKLVEKLEALMQRRLEG